MVQRDSCANLRLKLPSMPRDRNKGNAQQQYRTSLHQRGHFIRNMHPKRFAYQHRTVLAMADAWDWEESIRELEVKLRKEFHARMDRLESEIRTLKDTCLERIQ